MEKIEYKRLNDRAKFHWWNIGRRSILEKFLRINIGNKTNNLEILDIGCGAGENIMFLNKFGNVSGIDISEEALKFSKDKGYSKLIIGNAEKVEEPDSSYDIVSLLDVVEHLDDDVAALNHASRVLKKDGTLLLTVPAHKWLWSMHDKALHHRRRYTNKDLTKKITNAGFEIQKISHFVMPAIPFLLLKKMIHFFNTKIRKKSHEVDTYDVILPKKLNSILIQWLSFERFLMKYISLPFGSSLMVVANKK